MRISKQKMKQTLIAISLGLILIGLFTITACKSKSDLNDPTVLEIDVLAELDEGVPGNKLQKDLPEFNISNFKATNKTLNQYVYKVILKGQTSNELLKAFKAKPYVKSAIIAPTGDGPAQNLPSSKSTRTSPIKG